MRNAATDVIVVSSQVCSDMPRFRRLWQSSPKSYPFHLHSGGGIHGQSLLIAVCGLLSVFIGSILRTLSDIATFPSKSDEWWFERPQESKHRDHPENRQSLCMVSSTVSLQVDGLLLCFSSWISVWPNANSWHYYRMFLISMHDSPYTSVNWWWISIGVLPVGFKTWITARTLHFAVVLSRS